MRALPFIALACVLFTGCKQGTQSVGPDGEGTEWCLWIGADMDTYVSCGRVPCGEGDWNFGGYAELVVAYKENANKRLYVHFLIPNVPKGTVVTEAYLELFHGGKNEDGQTDDIRIPVQICDSAWTPYTLTWNNSPYFQPSYDFHLDLRSQAWSASEEIGQTVQGYFDDRSTHKGFILYWSSLVPWIEKGFYSLNHVYRTATDLWRSPRLLAKIRLPEGKTIKDVTLPPLPAGNDVPFQGQEVLMMRYIPGTSWPADWEVAGRK